MDSKKKNLRFGHSTGKVLSLAPIRVKLANGFIVQGKKAFKYEFNIDDPVIVCWVGHSGHPHKFKGVYYVDPEAIEAINIWERKSSYRKRYSHDTFGHRAESVVLETLRSFGLRAEKATDFEDERIGIDLWLLYKFGPEDGDLGEGWVWLPIDITVRRDTSPHNNGNKYDEGYRKGVIVTGISADSLRAGQTVILEDFTRSFNKAIDDFITCGQRILDRSLCKALEEQW